MIAAYCKTKSITLSNIMTTKYQEIVQKSTDSKIGMLYLPPSDMEDLKKVRSLTVW